MSTDDIRITREQATLLADLAQREHDDWVGTYDPEWQAILTATLAHLRRSIGGDNA